MKNGKRSRLNQEGKNLFTSNNYSKEFSTKGKSTTYKIEIIKILYLGLLGIVVGVYLSFLLPNLFGLRNEYGVLPGGALEWVRIWSWEKNLDRSTWIMLSTIPPILGVAFQRIYIKQIPEKVRGTQWTFLLVVYLLTPFFVNFSLRLSKPVWIAMIVAILAVLLTASVSAFAYEDTRRE